MNETYDLIVIGGGSAGLVAAGGAATLGAKTALIEKRALGGDCLYTGCVPSKALIRSARFAADVRRAGDFGFETPELQFQNNSFAAITNRVQKVIKAIEPHDSPARFEAMGVEVIFGKPRFLSQTEIAVELKNGEQRIMKAKRFCVATGSSPVVPPLPGLRETEFITNETVFDLQTLPPKMIILGGGAIGAELGQAFARFGAKVTMIEAGERILAKEDAEVSAFMTERLRAENVEILTQTKAVKARRENDRKFLTIETNGETREIETNEILIAAGRKPSLDGLELAKAGVEFDEKRVVTDEYLRTTAKHIFAAGDVTGHFPFTHTADYEAQIVLNNAFLFQPLKKKVDFRVVPWATFTSPEVGRVGLTEAEARAKFGGKIKIYRSEFTDNDRAFTEGEINGFAKVVCKSNNEIIGAHIIGANAGEIIHEFVWAVKKRWKPTELNEIIHVYPTLAKIVQDIGTQATLENLKSPLTQKILQSYLKIWH